ncbi:MAG: RNA polymerase sigma factor [Candidatus Dojkabacteria bacterium]
MDFESLYKLHFTSVYRFFYYKSVNTSEIEDLVHDVFMRFYTKYSQETFDEDESKKILYGYARNIYKEWVRARIKEKKTDFNDDIDYSDSFDSLPGKEFEEKLKSQRLQVQEALKLLNPKVKAVIEMRFLAGMSRKEIAEKLHMKENDVHTYQKRGVKYLDKIINS